MNGRRTLLLVVGIVAVLTPRRLLGLQARINTIGYEGTSALNPQSWLVTVTRIAGVLAIIIAVFSTDSTVNLDDDGDSGDPDTYV